VTAESAAPDPEQQPGAPAGDVEHLVVGHVSKPHGTRGEVFVWPLTDRRDEVFVETARLLLGDEQGVAEPGATVLEVERVRPFKRGLLVKFARRETRGEVEELAGRYLLAPLSGLAPLEEGEVFYHQLLGLQVVTPAGERVGRVREVYETEPTHLIPFAARLVRELDLAAGRLVIEPPPGLLEI
jgi:16S rRNA processing protein RimM